MSFVRILFFAFSFSPCVLFSQDRLPLGTWRSHLASNSSTTITQVGTKIYSGSPSSLFYFDTVSTTVKKLSKIDGLSQSSISKLGYSEVTQTMVIAYVNSQIDLVKNNTIYPINDIFNSKTSGSKKINHLFFYGNHLWISTDFGLVIYNLDKREVTEVYSSFTPSDDKIQIFSSCALNDSIFVATSTGLFKSSLNNSINKLDYRNWTPLYPPNLSPQQSIQLLATYKGSVFAACNEYLISYTNGNWATPDIVTTLPNQTFCNIVSNNNKLWFLVPNAVYYYDNTTIGYVQGSDILSSPQDLLQTDNNEVWISDNYLGLLRNKNSSSLSLVSSNGPGRNDAFGLSRYEDKISMVAGGYNTEYLSLRRPGEFSVFENGLWQNYANSYHNTPVWEDVISSAYNVTNKKVYFASYGWGMMEWDQKSTFKLFNNKTPGCPLNTCTDPTFCDEDYPNPSGGGNYCRVNDVAVDNAGKVWVINQQDGGANPTVLFSYNYRDSTWQSYPWSGYDNIWGTGINFSSDGDIQYLSKIIVDKNNTKWMSSRSLGLMAFNEKYAPLPRYLHYEKYKIAEICGTQVLDIVEDLDGAIWIATDNGVCYFSDATQVFQKTAIKASLPVYDNRALLNTTTVTSIEIDGGNRKWMGTTNSGAWLFSSDGTSNVLHFDPTNSPLPSNVVLDIKINNSTGEVFFLTDNGIYSYLGDAIVGEDHNTTVIAYPNPITQDFTGHLGISGLVNDATVKITDITGQLIYQTKAQGSLASWNIKDYTGRRAQPGVYLVFSSKEDGSEALATKIAILE
jgi:hypothetical protein